MTPTAPADDEFRPPSIVPRHETAITAAAAQAQAAIQARYVMALQRPRDLDVVRQRILTECRRPGFAEAALYRKPVGKSEIVGPSIRFAEAMIRCCTNILVETTTIYDDEDKRIVRVSVTDLEANITYPTDKVIVKSVERRHANKGQEILGERLNSYGDKVYIVRATEDDLAVKEAAIVSKAIRTNGLRMIPGDLLDEGVAVIKATLEAGAKAEDPAARKKQLADAFASMGVSPTDLKAYLGHDLDSLSPTEVVDLRTLYRSIKDGETTWQEIVELRAEAKVGPENPAERKTLVEAITRARIADPQAFAASCKAAGVTADNVKTETLSLEVLRRIHGATVPKAELKGGAA